MELRKSRSRWRFPRPQGERKVIEARPSSDLTYDCERLPAESGNSDFRSQFFLLFLTLAAIGGEKLIEWNSD